MKVSIHLVDQDSTRQAFNAVDHALAVGAVQRHQGFNLPTLIPDRRTVYYI